MDVAKSGEEQKLKEYHLLDRYIKLYTLFIVKKRGLTFFKMGKIHFPVFNLNSVIRIILLYKSKSFSLHSMVSITSSTLSSSMTALTIHLSLSIKLQFKDKVYPLRNFFEVECSFPGLIREINFLKVESRSLRSFL